GQPRPVHRGAARRIEPVLCQVAPRLAGQQVAHLDQAHEIIRIQAEAMPGAWTPQRGERSRDDQPDDQDELAVFGGGHWLDVWRVPRVEGGQSSVGAGVWRPVPLLRYVVPCGRVPRASGCARRRVMMGVHPLRDERRTKTDKCAATWTNPGSR